MEEKKPVKSSTSKQLFFSFSKLLIRIVFRVLFGCRYLYLGPFPKTGPVIFASNHLSNLDPPTVGAGIRREVYFIAKQELFRKMLFGALIRYLQAVPLRRGVMDWRASARLKEILRGGGSLLMFPEGTRSRDGNLGKGKFGVGYLAQETGATIVPVYVCGTNHLKDTMLRREALRVLYGQPIEPGEYAGFEHSTRGQLAISALIMERIAGLQQAVDS
ncbi:MAG: lysophospholipid acyltransferase family protein [Gemmatimonadota bacterium]|nr:lysophospholipid acyltransferase family protein [Gemmatimonadota bacterium]